MISWKMAFNVEIDTHSGFCGGVIRAIGNAEKFLDNSEGRPKKLVQRKYNNSKYYYMFLEDIKYAKDKEYINKLKEIAEELE